MHLAKQVKIKIEELQYLITLQTIFYFIYIKKNFFNFNIFENHCCVINKLINLNFPLHRKCCKCSVSIVLFCRGSA